MTPQSRSHTEWDLLNDIYRSFKVIYIFMYINPKIQISKLNLLKLIRSACHNVPEFFNILAHFFTILI